MPASCSHPPGLAMARLHRARSRDGMASHDQAPGQGCLEPGWSREQQVPHQPPAGLNAAVACLSDQQRPASCLALRTFRQPLGPARLLRLACLGCGESWAIQSACAVASPGRPERLWRGAIGGRCCPRGPLCRWLGRPLSAWLRRRSRFSRAAGAVHGPWSAAPRSSPFLRVAALASLPAAGAGPVAFGLP